MNHQIEIVKPTPVLNTADFHVAFGGIDGKQIPKNPLGHPLHYEFVALPPMRFDIVDILPRHHHFIYRVRSSSYPAPSLYIDSRFTRPAGKNMESKQFPSRSEILASMQKLLGTRYVWGGNWSLGIPEMLSLYPPLAPIDEITKDLWTLKGVDCSGLIYEVTHGLTPRNTSGLIYCGQDVPIANCSAKQILSRLEPLDMVVWPGKNGHVFFVFDSDRTIESKSPFGVIHRPLFELLENVTQERKGVDRWEEGLDPEKHFVIRRLKLND